MNQNSTSKQSIIIGALTGALVLAIGVSALLYFQNKNQPQAIGETKRVEKSKVIQYCNPRFGFCIDYPSDMTVNPPPENGDGQTFNDSNGFVLTVSGINNVINDTIETEMKSQSENLEKITYQAKGDNWFILSGQKGPDVFYFKTYVGDGVINHLYIQYPASANSKYTKAVAEISESFKPGGLNVAN